MSCPRSIALFFFYILISIPVDAQTPGTIDTTFGQNGEFLFQPALPNGGTPIHRNSVLQSDGKIVTLLQAPGGVNLGMLARLNPDGSLDNSFGSGGYVYTTWGGAGGQTYGMTKQFVGDEERFVAAGWASCGRKNCLRLERYTSTGAIDPAFGSGGVAIISSATSGATMAIQPIDQKILILVGGGVMRLTADGSPDPTFGSNGISAASGIGNSCIAVEPTGRIVVGGSIAVKKSTNLAVARLNTNGSLDNGGAGDSTPGDSFGTVGRVTTDFGGFAEGASSVDVDSSGRIVVAGSAQMGGSATSNYNAVLVRYSANGQIDTSFGTGGKAWLDIGGRQDLFKSLAFQTDGKIVLTGEGRFAGTSNADFLIARYNSDGTIDSSFGNGGWLMKDMYGWYDQAQSILVQSDPACEGCEKILVVGAGGTSTSTYQTVALRYHP